MTSKLSDFAAPIAISVAFYVFGFFVTASALHLSEPQIMVGLISGAIGGLTTLLFELREKRAAIEVGVLRAQAARAS